MQETESEILARALGPSSTRWMYRRMRSVSHEAHLILSAPADAVKALIDEVLGVCGAHTLPPFPSNPVAGHFSALTRSGVWDLNPTIIHIRVDSKDGKTLVALRAVAKEGLMNQHPARKLVRRFEALLKDTWPE